MLKTNNCNISRGHCDERRRCRHIVYLFEHIRVGVKQLEIILETFIKHNIMNAPTADCLPTRPYTYKCVFALCIRLHFAVCHLACSYNVVRIMNPVTSHCLRLIFSDFPFGSAPTQISVLRDRICTTLSVSFLKKPNERCEISKYLRPYTIRLLSDGAINYNMPISWYLTMVCVDDKRPFGTLNSNYYPYHMVFSELYVISDSLRIFNQLNFFFFFCDYL